MGRTDFDLEQQPSKLSYGVPVTQYPAPQAAVTGIQLGTPPVRDPLPFGGLGIGWVLFIAGFFLGIPWYVGALLLFYGAASRDEREKRGCTACLILAVILTVAVIIDASVAETRGSSSGPGSGYYYTYTPPRWVEEPNPMGSIG